MEGKKTFLYQTMHRVAGKGAIRPTILSRWHTACCGSLSRELRCVRNALGMLCVISLEAHVKSIPRCNRDVRAGDVTNQEAIKPTQMKLSLAFCVFTSALCEIVCSIWCCLSLLHKENGYSEQATTSFYNVRYSLPALSTRVGIHTFFVLPV